jgi:hypothetical protein
MFFTVVEVKQKGIEGETLLYVDKCTTKMLFEILEQYANNKNVDILVRKYNQ